MAEIKAGITFPMSFRCYCPKCNRDIGLDELKERGAKTQRQLKTADQRTSITELKVPDEHKCVCGSDTFHIKRE